MNEFSIATVSLSGTLEEKLHAIAAAGFAQVEIFENDFIAFSGTAKDVRLMCADLNLKICAFQPFRDFEGMPEPWRQQNFVRARRKFELMHELGTDLMLICSNVSPHALGGIDRAAADFHELGELAGAHDMRVGYEALAWGKHVNDYRDAWEIVRRAGHKSIGLILDSFHVLARRQPVEPIRTIPADRIFLVQLADAPRFELDVLSWSRHFRCFPGQGDLPVSDFMNAVKSTGYAGPLSLEIFNDQFRAGSANRVAKDGLRALTDLGDRLHAPALPPRVPGNGFAFLEFSLDEITARSLRDLFRFLGFAKTGQHKTKDVERWSQGRINLIINTDRDGFAHSHYVTHGPGVCAIGMDVADARALMARAAALSAENFQRNIGVGELEIPAIHGVGGSLIHFLDHKTVLDQVWEREFVPADAPPAHQLLSRIDHIAQSMPNDEMLSWLLYYESIFDMKRSQQLDIADPAGLMQSQALANPAGSTRIVLNSSTAARTMSSRFLSEFFGSGVQHIAFETPDIFAAVVTMRANGLTFLTIPANYYDDLEAKYQFAPEIIAALRTHHILYERDETGEFFQIYTHTFAECLFFEIVQRNNYQGYGAGNASIRLAAHES